MSIILIILTMANSTLPLKIDLGAEPLDHSWYVVNDGVMGGQSSGQIRFTDSTALWTGSISLENNGGFSAFRSDFSEYDLSSYDEVVIRYRSEGQALNFSLYPHERYYMPNYKVDLGDSNGEWVERAISLSSFHKYIMGKKYNNTLSRETAGNIIRLGFINGGKDAGPFTFEIDYVLFK